MDQKLICIRCPRGCELTTTTDGNGSLTTLTGNFCRMGREYAEKELSSPERILTTTVRVTGSSMKFLPVYTDTPIPKTMIMPLSDFLKSISVQAPVSYQAVIIENPLGLKTIIRASSPAPSNSLEN